MKALFAGGTSFISDGQRYFTHGNVRRAMIEEYSHQFEEVHLCMRAREGTKAEIEGVPEDAWIEFPNLRFWCLPPWKGLRGWLRNRSAAIAVIRDAVQAVDVAIGRIPSAAGDIAIRLAKRYGVCSACHCHGDPIASWANSRKFVRNSLLRCLAAKVVKREFACSIARADVVLSTSRSVIAPYCSDTSTVVQVANSNIVDADYHIPSATLKNNRFTFVTAGRLVDIKNVDIFLRAMSNAVQHGTDCVARIAGSGPEEGALRRLTQTLGISDRVSFLGQLDDRRELRALYHQADAAFLLSDTEGMPLMIMEAMAAGLPLLVSNIAQVRETVGSEDGAIFIEPKDVVGCERGIQKLVRDDAQRWSLAEASSIRGSCFHVSTQVSRLYRGLAQGCSVA